MNPSIAAEIRIAILKTGTTYPTLKEQFGDFDNWFQAHLDIPSLTVTVIDVTQGAPTSQPTDWDGVFVTGSPAMVSDKEPWSEATALWLGNAVDEGIPVFGVCYGHQLLAHATGGLVGYHPDGRETGTHGVELREEARSDPLFCNLPKSFPAHLTHKQSVLKLPEGAVLLASNDFEPHEAFRIGECAWGVQFHPEFSEEIMRTYLGVQAPELEQENLPVETLIDSIRKTPEASSLLVRFVEFVRERSQK